MTTINTRKILATIKCEHLALCKGDGYWYFIYDRPSLNIFETHSIYTVRLNDLPLETWVEEGHSFAQSIETRA